MNAVQKLRQMVGEIGGAKHPALAKDSWELVKRLLMRMPVSPAEIDRVCATGDVALLESLVARMEAPTPPPPERAAAVRAPASGPRSGPGATELERQMEMALRAFRKRLKVMRLADESKLRGRRLSSGKSSEIDAIMPPPEFPEAVWRALADAGRLKYTGSGFYALP